MLKCSYCKKELSEEEFSINPNSGVFYKLCDSCRNKKKEYDKKYYENNKDKIKEYYENNKDKINEQRKEYYENNKDKINEQRKEYREKNKDKLKEYNKEYYENNKDKKKEYLKEYREKNKDKMKAQQKEYDKKYVQRGALYSTYKDRFHPNEEIGEDEEGYLLVRCKYCNMLFNPNNRSVKEYLRYYDGTHNLYCSEGCKRSCPTYGQKKHEKGHKHTTSREVSPELRKIVLEKDDWECQLCGKRKDHDRNLVLHVHHINPVKINPILQNDIDNCITLCKKCHKKIHSKKGCRFIDLANCEL